MERWFGAMEGVELNPDFWTDKRVFLTGHTGFKGAWLAYWLRLAGCRITGYALPPTTSVNLYDVLGIDKITDSRIGDIRDADALKRALAESDADIVFHLAAQPLVRASYEDPIGTFSTNVMGTVNLLEAMRSQTGIQAAVIITTDKCYENNEDTVAMKEHFPLGGHDPYSASKACAEIVTAAYRRSYFKNGTLATPVASARAGNVIGGGDWSVDRLVPDMVRASEFGNDLTLRYPDAVRPWQHVLDALHGYIVLAEQLAQRGHSVADAFNFGPDAESVTTVLELVRAFVSRYDPTINIEITKRDESKKEAQYLMLDSSKARKVLGWAPRMTFQEAVSATAEWYSSHRAGKALPTSEAQIISMMEAPAA